ncbi:MAG TPA: hypothetical protein VEW42_02030 [Candidatus Eisenbacteria bacterium]|nr:hypothetical protein [Candidatus Eisenbacteria bacterium]
MARGEQRQRHDVLVQVVSDRGEHYIHVSRPLSGTPEVDQQTTYTERHIAVGRPSRKTIEERMEAETQEWDGTKVIRERLVNPSASITPQLPEALSVGNDTREDNTPFFPRPNSNIHRSHGRTF